MGFALPAADVKARSAHTALLTAPRAGDITPAAMATDSDVPHSITGPTPPETWAGKCRLWISVNLQWRVLGGGITLGCAKTLF